MKNQKEIYQALLDGKTLIHRNTNNKVSINKRIDFSFYTPQDWEIYDNTFKMKPAGEKYGNN